MVKKRTVLLLACLVWFAAGFNIARIGITSYSDYVTFVHAIESVVVFILFWRMFSKLVSKHTHRIHHFEKERQAFWRFFDAKSFLIMAFMMSGGMTIRYAELMPEVFIAVFYTGLGIALTFAGIYFGINYVCYHKYQED